MTAHNAARSEPSLPALFPDGVVVERFKINSVLGVGGSATVFEAEDLAEGRTVALKAIPAEGTLRRRARREMRVARALDHRAIVRLLDTAEDEAYIYVVFELVRGRDLSSALKERLLDETGILRAVAAVCDALEHAHARGVVHRDVKPGNILLRDDGVLKLTDFGIAHIDHPDATVDDRLLGTLSYMSPEQVRGDDPTGATDVWSAALVAFEALTRKNPYRSKSPVELAEKHGRLRLSLRKERPDLPQAVTRAIDAALDPDPTRRPSPGDLRDALLRGARAIETGDHVDDVEVPQADAPLTLGRRRRHLRVVPDPIDGSGEHSAERRLPSLPLPDLSAIPLDRIWAPALTGVAGAAMLSALPFYPRGWAIALGLVAALIAIRLPLLAAATVIALSLPLLGNHALGLAAPAALLGAVWLLLVARDGRRALLPVLAAPLALAFLWPVYPLLAGTSPRAVPRAALGAAGPIAIAAVCGLTGWADPLGQGVGFAGYAAATATLDDPIRAVALTAAAIGPVAGIQAIVWAILALTAPALWAARGRPLAIAAGGWLAAGTLGTLLAPLAVGQTLGDPLAILVGSGVAGILIAIRSFAAARGSAAEATGA